MVGPGKAPKWTQEARWQNPEDDIQDPQSSMSQGPEEAHKIAPEPLQAIRRVFLAHTDWSTIQTCKQKPGDSVEDFKSCLEALLLQHLGFRTIDKITQPALAALFVNELSPEISGLIKRQKTGWEATGLTELMTILEEPWS